MGIKSVLRESLGKIATGLLYGIGFGIAVGGIYYYISEKQMNAFWDDKALAKVVIKAHEKVARGQSVVVLGSMENQGDTTARVMNIQVDLFDRNGKFVDQCKEYVTGSLQAGETAAFQGRVRS